VIEPISASSNNGLKLTAQCYRSIRCGAPQLNPVFGGRQQGVAAVSCQKWTCDILTHTAVARAPARTTCHHGRRFLRSRTANGMAMSVAGAPDTHIAHQSANPRGNPSRTSKTRSGRRNDPQKYAEMMAINFKESATFASPSGRACTT
jgi:hypothetical protein